MTNESKHDGHVIDTAALVEELEHFRREKEKIRRVIGQIGGKATTKRDAVINTAFIMAIAALFLVDALRHLLDFSVPLAPLFSIELGLLLVSVKIIWMIHKSTKVEHFQFWILNSIEFRLNDLSKRLYVIQDRLGQLQGESNHK